MNLGISRFDSYLNSTFDMEGGWSNDKSDPGQATMFGLSARFNPKYADKILSRTLTEIEARSIIKKSYYDVLIGINDVAPEIGFIVFDAKFHGMFEAVKGIQKFINSKQKLEGDLVVDGVWGPHTLQGVMTLNRDEVRDLLNYERQNTAVYARAAANRVLIYQARHNLPQKDYFAGFTTRQRRRVEESEKQIT